MTADFTFSNKKISIKVDSVTEDFQDNWYTYFDYFPTQLMQEICGLLPCDAEIRFWINSSGSCEFSVILMYENKSFAVMDLLFSIKEKTMNLDNLRVTDALRNQKVGAYLLGLHMVLIQIFDLKESKVLATGIGAYVFAKRYSIPSSEEWYILRENLIEVIPDKLKVISGESYWT